MEENYHDNEFEKHFREKMEGFEDAPPKMAWENISSQIPPVKKNRWKRFTWLLLFIPICSVSFFYCLDSESSELNKIISEHTEAVTSELELNKSQKTDLEIKPDFNKLDTEVAHEFTTDNKVASNEVIVSITEKVNLAHKNKPTHIAIQNSQIVRVSSSDSEEIKKHSSIKPTVILGNGEKLEDEKESAKSIKRLPNISANKVDSKKQDLPNSTITKNQQFRKPLEIPLQSILPNTELIESTYFDLPKIIEVQKNQPKETSKSKNNWTFFTETSILYTSERIAPNQEDEWVLKGRESEGFTSDNLGVSVGLGISRNISERTKLDVLLNYSMLRKQLNFDYQSARPTSLSTTLDSLGVLQITPNYQNEEVSASIRYQLLSSNIGLRYQVFATKPNQFLKFGAGVSWLFHLQTKPKGMVLLEEKNWIHPSAYLGYEWNKPISDKINLGISPTINYYFSSLLTEKSSISAKPYSLGINLRLSF